jgi:hypothetical protein
LWEGLGLRYLTVGKNEQNRGKSTNLLRLTIAKPKELTYILYRFFLNLNMKKKSEINRTKWSAPQLQAHIRKESKASINVVFSDHVKIQMVMTTLQKGSIKRIPEPNTMKGSLECLMEYFVAGFDIGVIVGIFDENPSLILVTAMHV